MGEHDRLFRIFDRRLGVHDLFETVEAGHAALVHLSEDRQTEDRAHEDIHIEKECDEIRKRKRSLIDHPSPGQDHRHIDEVGEKIDAAGEIRDELIRSETGIPELAALLFETVQLEGLLGKSLHKADAGKAFFYAGRDFPCLLPVLTKGELHLFIHLHGVNALRNKQTADEEGKLPVHDEHNDQRPRHDDAAEENIIRSAEGKLTDLCHIACDTGEQLSRFLIIEVMKGELLDMSKQIPSHVVFDGRTHDMPIVLHRILDRKIQDVQDKKDSCADKQPMHIPRRQYVMDEITDHDRKDQIQSGHGKRPYDHPDQNVHVGTVIFHKFSYHSILLVFNKKQFVLYYNAKGMWLQGERRLLRSHHSWSVKTLPSHH